MANNPVGWFDIYVQKAFLPAVTALWFTSVALIARLRRVVSQHPVGVFKKRKCPSASTVSLLCVLTPKAI